VGVHGIVERADQQHAGILELIRHGSSGKMHRRSPSKKNKS
jgi:hypothetical protein